MMYSYPGSAGFFCMGKSLGTSAEVNMQNSYIQLWEVLVLFLQKHNVMHFESKSTKS